MLLAFVLAWFIQEKPLRQTVESSSGFGESFGAPVDTDSLREITRGLTRLVGRFTLQPGAYILSTAVVDRGHIYDHRDRRFQLSSSLA